MYKDEIKKLKIKKNSILYSVLFSLVFFPLMYFFAHRYNWIDKNILDGFALIILVAFLIFLGFFKNKFGYYIYRYTYLLMLEEDLPPIKTKENILSANWQQQFEDDGFILEVNNSRFTIYYQITNKNSNFKEFGKSFLCIVLNKDPELNFYGATIQEAIKKIYEKVEKKHNRLKKEVVIQFKKYEKFDQETKKEIQKILSFKQDSFSLINITVGYFPKISKVYYLRPEKRYPNKYYYLACKMIEKYI